LPVPLKLKLKLKLKRTVNLSKIPLVDLSAQHESIRDSVMEALGRILDSSQFILGDELAAFEREFASACGVAHCVGVANGTDALHLALRGLDVGPGDEVITAANTFIATALAIAHSGAEPVFVDVDRDGYSMDPELLEAAITPRTRAIIPVHLYGHPANMDEICAVAKDHDIPVIEDASQAHGATYQGRPVGSFGRAGCFSFYPGKNLGALGDGGAVVTDDEELADRLRLLRHFGQVRKNDHSILGFNSRLDTLQAAFLRIKLRKLDEWNELRRECARVYGEVLGGNGLVLPEERSGCRHVYHLYIVEHSMRDELLEALAQRGVYCGIHYPTAVHEQAPFRNARTVPHGAPVATERSRRMLSLPLFPGMQADQVRFVADRIHDWVEAKV